MLVVGDIDRGGVFAVALRHARAARARRPGAVAGLRRSTSSAATRLLAPGLTACSELTGRPTLGVLPWLDGPVASTPRTRWRSSGRRADGADGADTLDVAVVRLRWMTNFTDLDALAAEPGVGVRFTRSPADVERADLVVLPGTKATVEDLEWLRAAASGRAALRARRRRPVLGICGGYQMLGEHDRRRRRVAAPARSTGLGLLPVDTVFAPEKLLRRVPAGTRARRADAERLRDPPRPRRAPRRRALLAADDGEPTAASSARRRHVLARRCSSATRFRRALLAWVARAPRPALRRRARRRSPPSREAQLDALGDLIDEHVDTARLRALIERGVPAGLPTIDAGGAAVLPSS